VDDGPVLRATAPAIAGFGAGPLVATWAALVAGLMYVLFAAEVWWWAALKASLVVVGVSVVIAVVNPANRRAQASLARLRRSPVPLAGLDDWLDPACPGFGPLELELAEQHPLALRAIEVALPLRSASWTSATTLLLHPEWHGDDRDLAHLAELVTRVLAPHRDELGLRQIRCHPADLVPRLTSGLDPTSP
jgi:hypothetical protein